MDAVSRRKPGPLPRITRQDVVNAARGLQAEGRLTMTAIAEELGLSVAALYRYVPDKAAVVALLALEDHGAVLPPDRSLPWREWLATAVEDSCQFWLALPASASPARLPAAQLPKLLLREGLELLVRQGFSPADALTALMTVTQLGYYLSTLERLRAQPPDPQLIAEALQALQELGIQPDWEAQRRDLIDVLLDGLALRLS